MGVNKLVYALFCEHQSVDANGRNSYNGVFDGQTVAIRANPGEPKPTLPLPMPIMTRPFTLAMLLECAPNAQTCSVLIKDPNGQQIQPPATIKLSSHPQGRHRVNINFQNGLPVLEQGNYHFEISVGRDKIGDIVLTVGIQIL